MPAEYTVGPRKPFPCTFNPNPGYAQDCIGATTTASTTGTSGTPPPPIPSITKNYTLYSNMLPITIPSTVSPFNSSYLQNNEFTGDKNISQYLLKEPSIPTQGYSDISIYTLNDGTPKIKPISITETNLLGNTTTNYLWSGFNGALSKCNELDGTPYPICNIKPSCNSTPGCIQNPLCNTPSADPATCSTPSTIKYTTTPSCSTPSEIKYIATPSCTIPCNTTPICATKPICALKPTCPVAPTCPPGYSYVGNPTCTIPGTFTAYTQTPSCSTPSSPQYVLTGDCSTPSNPIYVPSASCSTPSNPVYISTPSCSTPSNPEYIITPTCNVPNAPSSTIKYKPTCYAVTAQSDFKGIPISDNRTYHTYNYKLIGLPTADYIDNYSDNRGNKLLSQFATGKQIDKNFLYCQPQFYTWVKNLDDPNQVYNQYSPNYKPSNITPNPNFNLFNCPSESYPSMGGKPNAPLEVPDWMNAPSKGSIPYMPPPKIPVNNTKRNIAIGVGVVVLLGGAIYWYMNFGPGASDDSPDSPPIIPTTPSANIQKTKGGYYFY